MTKYTIFVISTNRIKHTQFSYLGVCFIYNKMMVKQKLSANIGHYFFRTFICMCIGYIISCAGHSSKNMPISSSRVYDANLLFILNAR